MLLKSDILKTYELISLIYLWKDVYIHTLEDTKNLQNREFSKIPKTVNIFNIVS